MARRRGHSRGLGGTDGNFTLRGLTISHGAVDSGGILYVGWRRNPNVACWACGQRMNAICKS